MKKILVRYAFAIALVLYAGMAVAVDAARSDRKLPAVDAEQYAEFMKNEVYDLEDLVEGAELQRLYFNRITPPSGPLFQPMFPSVVPFFSENYEEAFWSRLFGESRNSVVLYPLSIIQDPETRETLIYNSVGDRLVAVPSDEPIQDWPENAHPSRITLLLDLLPSEDVEPYLYVEDRIDDSLRAEEARTSRSGGMTRKSLGPTEFGIADIQTLTNGNVRVTVTNGTDIAELFAYTVEHASTLSGSNIIWTLASPSFNGVDETWKCRCPPAFQSFDL